MSSQTKSSQMMRKGARFAATELLREPVKQAVREALHEEVGSGTSTSRKITTSTSGTSTSDADSSSKSGSRQRSSSDSSQQDQSSSGGRSKLATMGLVLAIVGVTYFARKRMSSTSGSAWSEQSPGDVATDDTEGGYVSEGEMQTAETANDGGTSATSDQ